MEFDDLPETPSYAVDRESARTELSLKIASQYRVRSCHLFASGTQAIYVVMDSLARHYGAKVKHDETAVFYFSKHLYRGTLKQTLPELIYRHPQIEFRVINLFEEDLGELSTCQVLFVESCSNPQGLFWEPANYSRMNPEGHLVVDNTWLSPAIFNPFDYPGANHKIVIDSCTKYISGGTCMLGSACFDPIDPSYKIMKTAIQTFGIQVATPSCQIVSEMIDTLDWRIEKSSTRTQTALEHLRQHPTIDCIAYPSPTITPSIHPSVVCIHIQTLHSENIGRSIKMAGFRYMTSFGHPEDSIDTGFLVDTSGIWLRIGFGYLDDSDLNSKISKLVTLVSHQ